MADTLILSTKREPGRQVVEDFNGSDAEDSKECVLDADKVLFVECLGQEMTENDLANYVSKYCEVKSAHVETDPDTKQSRGVVVCGSADVGIHRINNKVVNVARGNKLCRVFVSGMFPDQLIYESDIKGYFGQFGSILKIHTQFEKDEGFAVIYFSTKMSVLEKQMNKVKKSKCPRCVFLSFDVNTSLAVSYSRVDKRALLGAHAQ